MNAVFIGALFLFFGDFGILSSSNKLQILQSHDFLSLLICKCFVFMKTKDTIVKDKFSKKLELFHSPFSQLFSE